MKKKIIRKVRILVILTFVMFLIVSGLIYYAYQFSFKIPDSAINKVRAYTKAYLNIDFEVDKTKFQVSKHTLVCNNIRVMVPGKKPFFKAEKLSLFLASGTGILDYYYARAVIERVEVLGATIDETAERPQTQSNSENPIASLPFGELNVRGLSWLTNTACFTFPDFKADLLKGARNANFNASAGTGLFGGKGEIKGLIDLTGEESRFKVKWQHENLALFTPLALIKHQYGISIGDGKIDIELDWAGNLKERIASPTANLARLLNDELKGHLRLETGNFSWSDFSGKLTLTADKEDEKPWKIDFLNDNEKSGIRLKGLYLGTEKALSEFRADFAARNVRLSENFFRNFGIKLLNTVPGRLDLEGEISGNYEKIQGSGFAVANNWSYQGKNIKQARIDWKLTDKQWLELEGDLKTNIGDLRAAAKIGLKDESKGEVHIEGNLSSVGLQSLRPFIESPVSGKCFGPFKVSFNFFNPASASYDLQLEMTDGEFYTFKPKVVNARIYGTGASWALENPEAEFEDGGTIKLNGIVSSEKFNADAEVLKMQLATFGVPEEIASGVASLKAKISGSLSAPEVFGDLYSKCLYIKGQKLNSFKAQLALKDKLLDLSPMILIPFDDGMIDGYYSLNLETGKTRSFKLNFQKLDLDLVSRLMPDFFLKSRMKGRISGSVTFDGQREENYWDFFIDGRHLNLFSQDLDTLFLEGSLWGNQGEIRNLFIRAFGGKINISGQVLGPDKFDGSMEAESVYLDRINFLAQTIPGVRGEINCQGSIEWEGERKTGYFTLFGDKIRVKERELGNLGAEIIIDNKGMKVLKGEFDKLGVKLDGEIDWAGRKPYKADLKLKDVDLSFVTQAHGIKTFDYGGLVVDGKCSVSGDLASLTPDVIEMQLDSIKIQKGNDIIVSNKPMQLKYINNNLEVRSLELKYRQGILGIEGIFKPGGEAALVFTGKDFSLRALGSLLDLPDWEYNGNLSANASVFGTYPELKLRADAKIDDFEIANRKIQGVTAKLSGDTRMLNLEEFRVQLPASSFDLKGKVGISDLKDFESIDLYLTIPKGPISDLPGFMPSIIRQASGTMEGDLHLFGKSDSPKIIGEFKLSADELGISGMRKPFKKVDFAVSTNDQIINIDKLEAKLGKGSIKGEGLINFRDGPGSITARISGEKIDLSFLNFEINKASATFNIGGNLYNPEILGDVKVPRGKFYINTDLLKDRPGLNLFLNSLKYRINVEVPRNFWLKSSFLNAEMRGKFSVFGDLENVRLDGGISCVQGWLYFQRRKFRVDTGEIKFGGVENVFDPTIYVKSEGQVQNTQVYLTLQGRVSSFTPKIYSSPPMSEGDLLALLTLGRDMTSAMQSDSKDLFEDEILDGLKNSYISALIGTTISTALNLDELFMTSIYDKTEGKTRSFIRAGKYIGNNLFMAYEGTLDEKDQETYIFEYRLPKGFVVNLEFEEPEKDKRLGVRYDWKFW
ncbi:MAG: hypothetical protein Kow0029_24370 [Candidatus Rifleibacteriota bacterium]